VLSIVIVCLAIAQALEPGLQLDDTLAPTRQPTLVPSKTPTQVATESPICFHASSRVKILTGQDVRLDQLRYHDQVLTMIKDSVTGLYTVPKYSPVVAFTGVFPDQKGLGVEITTTTTKEKLVLSNTHLMYAKLTDDGDVGFHQAYKLRPLNSSVMIDSSWHKVSSVKPVETTGWFTPLTQEGTVVVNSMLASCHTGPSHVAARTFYQPLYWYLRMFPRQEGVLPNKSLLNDHWFSILFKRDSVIGQLLFVLITGLQQEKSTVTL
jgi:hypothetical protein